MCSQLRVGIDLDGVGADFVAGWIARYDAELGARCLDVDSREDVHVVAGELTGRTRAGTG